MKRTLSITRYLFLLSILLYSCGSDDDGGSSGINVENLVTNFDENPMAGASVGTIQASSGNTLSFSITSQTPTGALSINPSTGELTVANASLFDFETNPVINASISIIDPNTSATATAAINLNNLDDIASFLSTSEVAYTAAADGDWVVITAAEYIALSSNIYLVTKTGMSDTNYDMGPSSATTEFITATNVEEPTMPVGSFVFAVKYNLIATTTSDIKMKQSSTSVSTGYENLGNIIAGGEAGDNYAVIKGSDSSTTDTAYLAISDGSGQLGYRFISGINTQFGLGDSNDLPSTEVDTAVFFQGLSTTQKQW